MATNMKEEPQKIQVATFMSSIGSDTVDAVRASRLWQDGDRRRVRNSMQFLHRMQSVRNTQRGAAGAVAERTIRPRWTRSRSVCRTGDCKRQQGTESVPRRPFRCNVQGRSQLAWPWSKTSSRRRMKTKMTTNST